MSVSIIDNYLGRKARYLTKYACLLLDNIYQQKINNTKLFEENISRYVNDFILNNKSVEQIDAFNFDDINKALLFFSKVEFGNVRQKQIAITFFDFFLEYKPNASDAEMVKMSLDFLLAIAYAFMIDENTTSIVRENRNFKDATERINQVLGTTFTESMKQVIQEIDDKLKKEVEYNAKENKLFLKLWEDLPFKVQYNLLSEDISTDKVLVLAKLIYENQLLRDFNQMRVSEVVKKNSIDDEHTIIMMEILAFNVFKAILKNQNYDKFFIQTPIGFFHKKSNIKKLMNLTNFSKVKKKLCFKVNYEDFSEDYDNLVELHEDGYDIGLTNLFALDPNNKNIKKTVSYLFLNEELEKNLVDLKKFSVDNNIGLIKKEASLDELII